MNEIGFLQRRLGRTKYWPRPVESYRFWDKHIPGFSTANHEMSGQEVTQRQAEELKRAIELHARWQGKDRFVTKFTGWPRFPLLRSIFPDAVLIHLERHPGAIVFSYLKQGWRWSDLPVERFASLSRAELLEYYCDRYLAYYQAKKDFPADEFLQVRYEDMVSDLRSSMDRILAHCRLPSTADYEAFLDKVELRKNANDAWRERFSSEEGSFVIDRLRGPIDEMGYSA